MEDYDPRLKEVYLQVVDNQLRSGEIPEAQETLDRLIAEGYDRQHAKEMIAAVVVAESYIVLKTKQPFDRARYIRGLNRLPEYPNFDYEYE